VPAFDHFLGKGKEMSMTHADFMEFVHAYSLKCDEILDDRQECYGEEDDRLSQFFSLATEEGISPMKALMDLAKKHWSMAMNLAIRGSTDLRLWDRCCMDLRNYALLLAAVAHDERIQGTPGPLVTKLTRGPLEDSEDA